MKFSAYFAAVSLALATSALAAPTTMSVDLTSGATKTVTVSQTVAESLMTAGEATAAVQVKVAIDLRKAAEEKAAAELAKRAKALSDASDATLTPLSKPQCFDWAMEQTDTGLAFEALRVRWDAKPFPKSIYSEEGKSLWLLRSGGGSGGSTAKAVAALEANTAAAILGVSAEVAGVRKAVVTKGVVSDAEVAAAVSEMLKTTTVAFENRVYGPDGAVTKKGDEMSPTASDGATIVMKAGD